MALHVALKIGRYVRWNVSASSVSTLITIIVIVTFSLWLETLITERFRKHDFISDHLKFEDISEITNGMTDESVKVVQERLNMVIVYGELLLNQSFDSTEQAQAFGN